MLGFIIIRHVNSKITDLYWKESYTCIRKFYDNPIIIIDDRSNHFLNENITLTNCTVIYDKEHKGSGEILPYYYFHKLKPFDTAVIIHDSVFIQSKIDFNTDTIRFLWSFEHWSSEMILNEISELSKNLEYHSELSEIQNKKRWKGCFGCMSVIKWNFLNTLHNKHKLFDILPKIKTRANRELMERIIALISYNNTKMGESQFGDIHQYITWGTTFIEYLTKDYSKYPIMKVWTGR